MTTPLERLARRTTTDPFFLGFRLAGYARLHQLDDAALAARLGGEVELLAAIRLCRAPRTEPAEFRDDVRCVAEKFGLNPKALAEAAKPGLATTRCDEAAAEEHSTPGVFLAARDRDEPS